MTIDVLSDLMLFARYRHSFAVEHGVTQTSTQAIDESGFPVMFAIAWRSRSASWMLRHRGVLERYLT